MGQKKSVSSLDIAIGSIDGNINKDLYGVNDNSLGKLIENFLNTENEEESKIAESEKIEDIPYTNSSTNPPSAEILTNENRLQKINEDEINKKKKEAINPIKNQEKEILESLNSNIIKILNGLDLNKNSGSIENSIVNPKENNQIFHNILPPNDPNSTTINNIINIPSLESSLLKNTEPANYENYIRGNKENIPIKLSELNSYNKNSNSVNNINPTKIINELQNNLSNSTNNVNTPNNINNILNSNTISDIQKIQSIMNIIKKSDNISNISNIPDKTIDSEIYSNSQDFNNIEDPVITNDNINRIITGADPIKIEDKPKESFSDIFLDGIQKPIINTSQTTKVTGKDNNINGQTTKTTEPLKILQRIEEPQIQDEKNSLDNKEQGKNNEVIKQNIQNSQENIDNKEKEKISDIKNETKEDVIDSKEELKEIRNLMRSILITLNGPLIVIDGAEKYF